MTSSPSRSRSSIARCYPPATPRKSRCERISRRGKVAGTKRVVRDIGNVILRCELLRASKDEPHAVQPSFEARRRRRAPQDYGIHSGSRSAGGLPFPFALIRKSLFSRRKHAVVGLLGAGLRQGLGLVGGIHGVEHPRVFLVAEIAVQPE